MIISNQVYQAINLGSLELYNQKKSIENCYTVDIKYSIPATGVQVAVTPNQLDVKAAFAGVDYSVRGRKSEYGNSIEIELIVQINTWAKINVGYLATSRKDVLAGSFIADTFPLFGCDKKATDKGVVKYAVPGLPSGKYEIAAFISGVRSGDSQQKTKITYSINSQFISIEITSTSSPAVYNLHISYVLVEVGAPFSFSVSSPPATSLYSVYQLIGPN